MSKFPLFLITLKLLVVDSFDPSKIDYCKLRCESINMASTACNCKPAKDRTYVTENMEKFRQLILDTHNKLRNKIARGDEKDFPSAANMHILSYDLELEHLAKCYVMSPNFTRGHDRCRKVSYCNKDSMPGQNIAGISDPEGGNDATLVSFITEWYDDLKKIQRAEEKKMLINRFQFIPYEIENFTQVVWATTKRIGCARAKIPNNIFPDHKFVLLCNYAGPDDECAANFYGKSVYQVGKPCSKCGKTKCNKDLGGKYDALCGNEVTASKNPKGKQQADKSSAGTSCINYYLLCLLLFLSY